VKRKTEARTVVDASAVLAYVHRERGYEMVRPILHRAVISTVNLEEVLVKTSRHGSDPLLLAAELKKRGLRALPYTEEDALASTSIDSEMKKRRGYSNGQQVLALRGGRRD